MRIACWNCEGIRSKSDHIHQFFRSNNLDAMILVETWLPPGSRIDSDLIQQHIPGVTTPDGRRPNGGISLMTRHGISSTLLQRSSSSSWGMWLIDGRTIVIGVYLRPLLNILQVEAELCAIKRHLLAYDPLPTVIMGDFNTHIAGVEESRGGRLTPRSCPRSSHLLGLAAACSLRIHNLDRLPMEATNIGITSRGVPYSTTVDYCLSHSCASPSFRICAPPAATPHRVLSFSYAAAGDEPLQQQYPGIGRTRYLWNRRALQHNPDLRQVLSCIYSPAFTTLQQLWSEIIPELLADVSSDAESVIDEAYEWSVTLLIEAGRGIAGGTPPRMNPRLRRFLRKWNAPPPSQRDPEPTISRLAAEWRPGIGHLPISAMLTATRKKLSELRTATANYADSPPPDAFQRLFSELYSGKHEPSTPPPDPPALADDAPNPFMSSLALAQLKNDISTSQKGKALGLDQLPVSLLSIAPRSASSWLQSMFKIMFGKNCTPRTWRKAQIVLLYKKGDPLDPGNYRPIALISHLRKLYERTLRRVILQHRALACHPLQCGFQRNVGADDCANAAAEALFIAESARANPTAVLLDIQKAYDSVVRNFLWDDLDRAGLPKKLIHVLRSLFEGAVITISYQRQYLPEIQVKVGLLQGAVLSTSLFNRFIDPLIAELAGLTDGATWFSQTAVPLLAFADDITLLGNGYERSLTRLQSQLDACDRFAIDRGFRFSPSKCVSTGPAAALQQLARLRIHGQAIPTASTVDILGIPFTNGAYDSATHISRQIAAAQSAANLLSFAGVFRSGLTLHRKSIIAKAFARSHLEYGLHLISRTAPNRDALDRALKGIAASVLCVGRGTVTQLRALGLDSYRSRLPTLSIRRYRRVYTFREKHFVLRLLSDRVQRSNTFTGRLLPSDDKQQLLELLDIDRQLMALPAPPRARRDALLHRAAGIEQAPLIAAWRSLIHGRRTVAELNNDPRLCHWSLRIHDPDTNHLWGRYLCGIWVPGHPSCSTCPPAPDGNRWPLTRAHLMHCTGAAEVLPPLIDQLLTLPIIDDLAGPHDRSASNPLESAVPPTAPVLSRLAAIRPDRLQWAVRPGRVTCETSYQIIQTLRPLLQSMQQRIHDLIPPSQLPARPRSQSAATAAPDSTDGRPSDTESAQPAQSTTAARTEPAPRTATRTASGRTTAAAPRAPIPLWARPAPPTDPAARSDPTQSPASAADRSPLAPPRRQLDNSRRRPRSAPVRPSRIGRPGRHSTDAVRHPIPDWARGAATDVDRAARPDPTPPSTNGRPAPVRPPDAAPPIIVISDSESSAPTPTGDDPEPASPSSSPIRRRPHRARHISPNPSPPSLPTGRHRQRRSTGRLGRARLVPPPPSASRRRRANAADATHRASQQPTPPRTRSGRRYCAPPTDDDDGTEQDLETAHPGASA